MKFLYKLFIKYYLFILLLSSLTLWLIDYYYINFKNEIYTSNVLKSYPNNNYWFLISIFFILFLVDIRYKIFQKFILLLNQFNRKLIIIIIIKILLILTIFDIVFFRRVLLFVLFLPYLIYFFFKVYYSVKIKKKIFAYFSILGLIIAIFPGYYLHPFFSGIPGWGLNLSDKKYLSEKRIYYKIYADYKNENIEEYFSHALFNPITHFGRPLLNFQRSIILKNNYKKNIDISDYEKSICKTLIDIYADAYPYLKKGIFPYQKNFHKFSYPTHNMSYVYENYKKINPKKIKKILFLDTYLEIDIKKEKINKFEQKEIFQCNYEKY